MKNFIRLMLLAGLVVLAVKVLSLDFNEAKENLSKTIVVND